MHAPLPASPNWYAVHIAPRSERRIQRALERLGYATMLLLIEVKAGPRYCVLRNLLAPYMLVRFDVHRDAWAEIREIDGVNRIVGNSDEHPVAVPFAELAPLAMACALDLRDVNRAKPADIERGTRRSRKPRNHRRLRRASRRLRNWIRLEAV